MVFLVVGRIGVSPAVLDDLSLLKVVGISVGRADGARGGSFTYFVEGHSAGCAGGAGGIREPVLTGAMLCGVGWNVTAQFSISWLLVTACWPLVAACGSEADEESKAGYE